MACDYRRSTRGGKSACYRRAGNYPYEIYDAAHVRQIVFEGVFPTGCIDDSTSRGMCQTLLVGKITEYIVHSSGEKPSKD